jgi:hypothetical protein
VTHGDCDHQKDLGANRGGRQRPRVGICRKDVGDVRHGTWEGTSLLCRAKGSTRDKRVVPRERDELVKREGRVEVPGWTTIMPKRNKAHQDISPIILFSIPDYVISPTWPRLVFPDPESPTHQCGHCPCHGICTLSYSRPLLILNSRYDPSFKFIWVKS